MGFVRIWPLLAGLCAIYLVAKLTQHFGGGTHGAIAGDDGLALLAGIS
jgi:hypothetical protein